MFDEADDEVERLPLNVDAVGSWLRTRGCGSWGELRVARQFNAGQSNPTYELRSEVGGHRVVLRRKPDGALFPSAHDVAREHRVLLALQGSAVPVPKTRPEWLCTDGSVLGVDWYLMSYVPGRVGGNVTIPPRRSESSLEALAKPRVLAHAGADLPVKRPARRSERSVLLVASG